MSPGNPPKTSAATCTHHSALRFAILILISCLPAIQARASEDIAVTIINHLESAYLYERLVIRGVTLSDHQVLRAFYERRRFEPIWVSRQGAMRRVDRLRRAIDEAGSHGLDPQRYPLLQITEAFREGALGDAELLLSDTLLQQARHRSQGLVDPSRIDPDWHLAKPQFDGVELLRDIAKGRDVIRTLNRLWPESADYWRLLDARMQLLAEAESPDPDPLPVGRTLRPGDQDPRVPALRRRLSAGNSPSTLYDLKLSEAVARFQRASGLEPDTVVGRYTIAALNRTRGQKIQQIDANLERWRWLPAEFPERYILVNVADFHLRAMRRKRMELSMPVIVGLPERQTPVFTETMQYLVFNPFWEIPRRIAVVDQLPKLRADAKALAERGFEAAPAGGGRMRSVAEIDWRTVTADSFPYRLRQRPGPWNPLGSIKFMLPNEYAIYLHDTPSRALFERTERTYSSGCIRVGNAVALAEWVLAGNRDAWDREQIETAITSQETRTVVLEDPTPVFIVYFTAYSADTGELVLQRDIYDRDAGINKAMNITSP